MSADPERPKRWSGYRRCAVSATTLAPGYDAVVVGAGIGGLVCAASLAVDGCRVLVVDGHALPGGLCSFFKRKGFYFDAGAHYFGGLGDPKSFVGLLLRPLKLDLTFLPQDPVEILHFPDRALALPANFYDYVALLQRLHPDEHAALAAFFDDALRVYRHQYRGRESALLQGYRRQTFQQVLDHAFHSTALKGILGASVGFAGVRPTEISAAAMAAVVMSYHYDGGYLLEGGSQSLPDSLMWRFAALGGDLLLGTKVRRVLVEQGRVAGVELASGQQIRAHTVISNADARHTLRDLVGRAHVGDDYLSRLDALHESNSLNVLYLGLRCDAAALEGARGWYWDGYDLNDRANRFRYLATPTLEDPSLAPPGHHILTVTSACSDTVADDGDLYTDVWSRRRAAYAEDTLQWLDGVVPGVAAQVVTQETATRRTVHHYTGNSRGAVYGWGCEPGQFGSDRLGIETPVKDLFLCGHWAEPGPGIASVAVSGALAARRAAAAVGAARSPRPVAAVQQARS